MWCATISFVETTKALRKARRLTRDEVEAIRLQYAAGTRQVDLADAFNVHQSTISRVLRPDGGDFRRREIA